MSAQLGLCVLDSPTIHDIHNCLMKGLGGFAMLKCVQAPSVRMSGAPSQTRTLEEFASTLAPCQLRAVAVDTAEAGIEGGFFLAV